MIQDDLVARSLDALGCRVELVKEHEPTVLALGQRCAQYREHIERHELGTACLVVKRGQTIQVGGIAHRQANVDQLQVVVLGNGSHDGRLANAGAGLHEGNQASIEAALHVAADLAGTG